MNPEQAADLLKRYRENSVTPAEQELVETWFAQLKDSGEWEWSVGERERRGLAIEEALLREITGRSGPPAEIPLYGEEPGSTGRRWIRWWVAAASVLVVAGGVGWWYQQQHRTGPAVLPVAAVVRPGSEKAVLTLADGRQVVLDTTADGAVIREKGVNVTKVGRGLLAYKGKTEDIGAYNTLTVPKGGIYQLELPDGSHVWLNSSSSLRYPTAFTGSDRAVELKGEGYFEVAHDPARPFAVTTGGTKVEVLGTGFDIMGYTDESALKVTLVQGSVTVSASGGRTLLRPGEQVAIGGAKTTVQRADLPEVLAWKDGEFRFKGMDIEAIMRQVARWYDVEILYDGPKPVNRFGGVTPRKSEVGELLAVLEATHKVHFKQEGNKITVIGGPGP